MPRSSFPNGQPSANFLFFHGYVSDSGEDGSEIWKVTRAIPASQFQQHHTVRYSTYEKEKRKKKKEMQILLPSR